LKKARVFLFQVVKFLKQSVANAALVCIDWFTGQNASFVEGKA